jgi:CRP-like cAMP-binding protein
MQADRRAIIDIYLPGDFIGLDAAFKTRPIENVLTLTSVEGQAIGARTLLSDAMVSPSAALFVAWLLGRRQQRADRLLAAISGCDARGRLAMMVLDLHQRLRARKLITQDTFNMPLTQQHIGEYLGLTVVHVNRVLKSLRVDRIASLERHCLTILDMRRLVQLSRKREMPDAGMSGPTGDLEPSPAPLAALANIGFH